MTATVNGAALAVHGLRRWKGSAEAVHELRGGRAQVPVIIGADEQIGFEDLMNPARSGQSG
jgi:hypothetical protein